MNMRRTFLYDRAADKTMNSGAGKTQFLLLLSLAVQMPISLGGLDKNTIYISTEAPLSTTRLSQLLRSFQSRYPNAFSDSLSQSPSLDRVITVSTGDLESQDHILAYQLPLAIIRHNIGLVILDSVAANYRAEFERNKPGTASGPTNHGARMAQRSADLIKLGALLQGLARKHNIAVVVANQVSDRFSKSPVETPIGKAFGSMGGFSSSPFPYSSPTPMETRRKLDMGPPDATLKQEFDSRLHVNPEVMTLDHQQRWFTGWGDEPPSRPLNDEQMAESSPYGRSTPFTPFKSEKTPSLGLVWANCITARIVLLREPIRGAPTFLSLSLPPIEPPVLEPEDMPQVQHWKRRLKIAFAPWTESGTETEISFKISPDGIYGL
jgi:DNA repair protein RAD57